jgi:hypothetical protein
MSVCPSGVADDRGEGPRAVAHGLRGDVERVREGRDGHGGDEGVAIQDVGLHDVGARLEGELDLAGLEDLARRVVVGLDGERDHLRRRVGGRSLSSPRSRRQCWRHAAAPAGRKNPRSLWDRHPCGRWSAVRVLVSGAKLVLASAVASDSLPSVTAYQAGACSEQPT